LLKGVHDEFTWVISAIDNTSNADFVPRKHGINASVLRPRRRCPAPACRLPQVWLRAPNGWAGKIWMADASVGGGRFDRWRIASLGGGSGGSTSSRVTSRHLSVVRRNRREFHLMRAAIGAPGHANSLVGREAQKKTARACGLIFFHRAHQVAPCAARRGESSPRREVKHMPQPCKSRWQRVVVILIIAILLFYSKRCL
jgi:hypothetical protein